MGLLFQPQKEETAKVAVKKESSNEDKIKIEELKHDITLLQV